MKVVYNKTMCTSVGKDSGPSPLEGSLACASVPTQPEATALNRRRGPVLLMTQDRSRWQDFWNSDQFLIQLWNKLSLSRCISGQLGDLKLQKIMIFIIKNGHRAILHLWAQPTNASSDPPPLWPPWPHRCPWCRFPLRLLLYVHPT